MATDFVRDANPKALYLAGLNIDLPDYLKDYQIPTPGDMEKMSSAAFADKGHKLHPIHTKEAAVLSGIYLHGTGMADSPQMQYVKQAAEIFGVSEDLRKILEQLDSLEKQASAADGYEEEYAMLVEDEEGNVIAHYPINNEVQLCKSAQALYNDFVGNKFPADWAHSAATKIVKKANELRIQRNELPERIWILGTERLVDFDIAKKMASYRNLDGADEESSKLYVELVKSASEDRERLPEYIKLWADLDMTLGVSYKDTFTPQEAFYTGPAVSDIEKMASQVVLIKDVMVPQAEFCKLSSDEVQYNFREEIADVVESAVKLASTDPALASKYVSALDEENQEVLLTILASQ